MYALIALLWALAIGNEYSFPLFLTGILLQIQHEFKDEKNNGLTQAWKYLVTELKKHQKRPH